MLLSRYHSKSERTKAYIQMHLSVILWGATGVLGRGISLGEGMLVWYRMMLVSATLFIYLKLSRTSLHITRKDFWNLSLIGTILMAHWMCFYGAIKYSNVSITLSLFSSTTLFTALIEPVVTSKRLNRTELLYSVLAMVGIGIIFYKDPNSYSVGMVLAVLAAFIGAFFNILNKKMVEKHHSGVVSFYEIATGFVVLSVFLPLYIRLLHPAQLLPSGNDWLLLLILAILCTDVALILSLNALRHLSAFTLNLSVNLEPLYGILMAFFIFHENRELNIWFFVGASIIAGSVLLHSYFNKNK